MRVSAVVPAAGRGERLKSHTPKPFVPVMGRPLLVRTLRALLRAYPFQEIVVLTEQPNIERARRLLKKYRLSRVRVEPGGRTRAESVRRGVLSLKGRSEWVLVHDAARPWISRALVRRTLEAAQASGAALCVMPMTSTVKCLRPARNVVSGTADRRELCLAQTPQVFRRDLLLARYRILGKRALKATDEAALFDKSAVVVRAVGGDPRNLKVTTPEDLGLLEYYLRSFSCV